MHFEVRKVVTTIEETRIEGGKLAPRPIKMVGVAYVIKNPWAGHGFVEYLLPEITAGCSELGAQMVAKILAHFPSGDAIEAYGKAAIAGLDGEIEHASALIHTLRFGNFYREAVEAKSYLAFTNTRGGANAPILVPLMDKNDAGRRSHYLTIQFSISDAPRDNELVIALGAATSGRPHHRIGDRYQDLKDLGHDMDNPASV